ncbi:MAG TPA: hypothetical protein VKA86_15840 [Candidatus Krumholzibacteria bacterium]|nr:hypothetical protein [Candidatus Krumholzibacteria bacterium]
MLRDRSIRVLVAILSVFPLVVAVPVAATPTVESMEWLGWPDAVRSVSKVVVNDDGVVALTAATELNRTQGHVRVGGEWAGLLSWQSSVESINALGEVTGWKVDNDFEPTHGYVWSPSSGFATTESVQPASTSFVRATATSDDGVMVGRICLDDGSCWPFRWEAGGVFDVLTKTVEFGEVMARNVAGTMLVRRFAGSRNEVYLIEPDDTVVPLPEAPWDLINPLDLNSAGIVVGDAETSNGFDQAFLYDGATYSELPLPAGYSSADAHAINDFDQIAGWGWDGGLGAIVWEAGRAHDLSALVSAQLGRPVDLKKAFDVSETGWVVGWGTNAGAPEIFRVKLGPPCRDPENPQGMITWTGGAGSYDDTANWSADFVPGSEDVLRFDTSGGDGVVDVSTGPANASLVLDGGPGVGFEFGDASWSLSGADPCLASLVTRPGNGELSLYDFTGGTLDLAQGADLGHDREFVLDVFEQTWSVGGAPLIAGHADTTTVNFHAGSQLSVSNEVALGLRTGTRARLEFDTANANATRWIVGSRGSGTVELTSSQLTGDRIVLGEIAGSEGTFRARGDAGSFVIVDDAVVVGEAGSGELEIDTTALTAGRVLVGDAEGSNGQVFVGDAGLVSSDDITIGGVGAASVLVIGTGELSQSTDPQALGWCVLGADAGGYGELGVLGASASASLGGLVVGSAGTGLLSLSDASITRVAGSIIVGDAAGGIGTVDVDGALLQSTALYVGSVEGSSGLVSADSTALVTTEILEIGPGGRVEGEVLAMDRTETPKHSARAANGIRTAELVLSADAQLAVDDVQFGADWSLGGDGAFPFDVTNDARVDPGTAAAPGRLTVDGNYEQTADGHLRIDLFGPEDGPVRRRQIRHDTLSATGGATLGGTLVFALEPGFEPEIPDTVTVLDCAGGADCLQGAFDAIETPASIDAELITDGAALRAVVRPRSVAVDSPDRPGDTVRSRNELSPVAPNPFNPRASFSLVVERSGPVRVRVLDLRGRVVDTLFDGTLSAGHVHTFAIDGTSWASGTYFVDVRGPGLRLSRKTSLVK